MKRHSFLFTGLIAAAFACAVTTAGAAPLITNGSFENVGNPSDYAFYGAANTNTTIPDWTGFTTDGYNTRIGINGTTNGFGVDSQVMANNGAIPDGSHVGFLQAPGPVPGYTSLSQSISGLVDGQEYEFSFYTNARDQADGGSSHVAVTLGSQTIVSPTLDLAVQPAGSFTAPYHFIDVDFTYNASWGSTLSFLSTFSSLTPGDEGTILLDGASLVAVPEPSTMALGALGLAGLTWRMRRRKA